jgi:hypothetical protein
MRGQSGNYRPVGLALEGRFTDVNMQLSGQVGFYPGMLVSGMHNNLKLHPPIIAALPLPPHPRLPAGRPYSSPQLRRGENNTVKRDKEMKKIDTDRLRKAYNGEE